MPKIAKPLGALEVKRLSEAKLHPVGTVPGLMLKITESGAKSWILRTTISSRRTDLGLGSYPAVSLAEAHGLAREARTGIKAGVDPVAERRASNEKVTWTFEKCAQAYIEGHEAGWKNAKHGQQWRSTLETYAFPKFGAKHVKEVDISDVISVIEPIWTTKNETADRVRNRIELVLNWASARGYRDKGLNPASWRGNIDQVLPKASKVAKVQHHPAVGIDDMFAFMQRLRAADGISAKCLEFAILTASRSGESRMATWPEIDLDGKVWNVPAERMKSGRPHRVPLSAPAISLLNAMPRFEGIELVFPGQTVSKPLSDMSLTAVMRRFKLEAVPHGFRSTFSDWCAERTAYPAEVREMALAHAVGNATEAAYRRGDLFDKRRRLMDDWASFLDAAPVTGGNVVQIRAA